ncbi:hypothetical protein bcgnr5372_26670 [Bacillus luti]|nr:hypothetical protein [Bacillus cereus]HDR8330917.1 hypothetical protein [Bacillus cereus]HDR8335938.1 hypothetical protein [Bacillus cereus]
MKKLINQIRTEKKANNICLLVLFVLLLATPEDIMFSDVIFACILYLIVYVSKYAHIEPALKGLLYAFIVVAIFAIAYILATTLFPAIPHFVLMLVVLIAGVLCARFIG